MSFLKFGICRHHISNRGTVLIFGRTLMKSETSLAQKKGYEDNHFLKKIYHFDSSHFRPIYDFHLEHFSSSGGEREFYRHLWQLTESRIDYFKSRDPFSRNRATNEYSLARLVEFQDFLKGIDEWKVRPLEEIMAEHEMVIAKQFQTNGGSVPNYLGYR